MATVETVLIRRYGTDSWGRLKIPRKYLFNPDTAEHLSKELDAEVVICLVQTTSSVFIFYRYKQGKMQRKIEIDEDSFSAEGTEEAWEKHLFEGEDQQPYIGGNAIKGLVEGLGLSSIFDVPTIQARFTLPKGLATTTASWKRILKAVILIWLAVSFLAGLLTVFFRD